MTKYMIVTKAEVLGPSLYMFATKSEVQGQITSYSL